METNEKIIKDYFEKIEKYTDEEEYDQALNYVEKILKIDSKNLKAFYNKCLILFLLEKDLKSEECVEKLLVIDPKYVDALNLKGLLLLEKDEKYKALDFFNEALELEPEHFFALKNKGRTLYFLEKFEEALNFFDLALKVDDQDPELFVLKGTSLTMIEDSPSSYKEILKESIRLYEKALEIDNQYLSAYFFKALSLYDLDLVEKSINELNKALNIDPEFLDATLWKSRIYRNQEKYEKALNCLEKIINIEPDYHDAYFEKGNVFKDLGKTNESIKSYESFIEIVKKNKVPDMENKITRTEEYLSWVREKGTTITFTPGNNPRYWQWATRAEYFLEEDGTERKFLEPGTSPDPNEWWTCHKNTLAGDLILLYRAGSKKGVDYKDIKYLIMASSDAYPLEIEEAAEESWKYGCHFTPIYKFKNSLKLDQMIKDPYLEGWNALNARFRRQAYSTKEKYWKRLNDLLSELNPDYKEFLSKFDSKKIIAKIKTEREFETELIKNIHVLQKFDLDLDVTGRQVHIGSGGFIDILGKDKTTGDYMVIELKIEKANRNTFGQISEYIGWVMKHKAKKEPVKGIVISRGMDQKFKAALNTNPTIKQIELSNVLSELGMKLK